MGLHPIRTVEPMTEQFQHSVRDLKEFLGRRDGQAPGDGGEITQPGVGAVAGGGARLRTAQEAATRPSGKAPTLTMTAGGGLGPRDARLPGICSPGYWNLDSAVTKRFIVSETKFFEFRWEAFNALNH
jgi:hypothetical protein